MLPRQETERRPTENLVQLGLVAEKLSKTCVAAELAAEPDFNSNSQDEDQSQFRRRPKRHNKENLDSYDSGKIKGTQKGK